MQQGEQALTGELGLTPEGVATGDRDTDCVKNIGYVNTASTLSAQVYFHAP
jgi:hypothetical protein